MPPSDGAVAPHPKVVSFRSSISTSRPHLDFINEQSPLIMPRRSEEESSLLKVVSPMGSDDDWQLDADEETKSSFYLFLLTLGGLGLQIGWSVETSNGSVSRCLYLHKNNSYVFYSQ